MTTINWQERLAERNAKAVAYKAEHDAEELASKKFEADCLEYAEKHLDVIPAHSRSNFLYGISQYKQGQSQWINKYGYQLMDKINAGKMPGWKKDERIGMGYYMNTEAGSLRLITPNYKSDPYKMRYTPCNNEVEEGLMQENPELYKVS